MGNQPSQNAARQQTVEVDSDKPIRFVSVNTTQESEMFIVTMIEKNGRRVALHAFSTKEEAELYATSLNADYIINEVDDVAA